MFKYATEKDVTILKQSTMEFTQLGIAQNNVKCQIKLKVQSKRIKTLYIKAIRVRIKDLSVDLLYAMDGLIVYHHLH